MANEININDFLGKKEQDSAIVDPNLARSSTPAPKVDIGDLGLKSDEPEPAIQSDKEKGLDLIDKMIDRKHEEIKKFNQALEEHGGELSAEEWARMNGEGGALDYIAEHPSDGTKAEMARLAQLEKETQKPAEPETKEEPSTINDELEQLEKEAASFDAANSSSVAQYYNREPEQTFAEPSTNNIVDDKNSRIESRIKKIDTDKTISEIENELKALDGIETEPAEKPRTFEEKLKQEIEKKIINNSNIPISSFSIDTDSPITADSIIEQSHNVQPTFKWVLYHTGVPFTMRPFITTEIDTLSELVTSSQNNASNVRKIYELIYSHIEDGKGEDFESWCRGVSNLDVQHLWMGVYGACFQFSNYIPYECDGCKEIVIPDSIPIMDMVKYKNTEAKDRFDSIMGMTAADPDYSKTRAYALKAISPHIAVRIKIPTLYETVVEPAMLDSAFTKKYQDIISLAESIEEIYFIDPATKNLRRVLRKVDMNNKVKTLKFKILNWAKIIYSLNSDERGILYSVISSIAKDDHIGDITYVEPEVVCDKCGATIKESATSPSGLVFTRHQLAAFGALQ